MIMVLNATLPVMALAIVNLSLPCHDRSNIVRQRNIVMR